MPFEKQHVMLPFIARLIGVPVVFSAKLRSRYVTPGEGKRTFEQRKDVPASACLSRRLQTYCYGGQFVIPKRFNRSDMKAVVKAHFQA